MIRRTALRRNPLVIDPDNCDPLFDELYEDEQELRDEQGAFERLDTGSKWRKPALSDE
ncbi:hypothetical protein [Mesorhizobium sp. M8A.F.Ca.ET.021.01.1.1]|uniref:hypothetical protein n=1 Tax=Mesorhizobium sp. M8A.F.Ca.ET.021.01.1.1 TaxID=2496757 RepID=UPI00167AD73E|nr:hypothetical protein [Mesorhizobium sp. M8A.F.Ca.ET.021.01.1.1]